MADVIEKALLQDDSDSNLKGQMEAFKDILIHDITPKEFADVYAQTIVYGMFAARLHDTTPDTFSRHEAATLIPKTNPFLRQLFQNVAGYDLDDRISWIVDDSAEIFRAADMRQVMAGFGHRRTQHRPKQRQTVLRRQKERDRQNPQGTAPRSGNRNRHVPRGSRQPNP